MRRKLAVVFSLLLPIVGVACREFELTVGTREVGEDFAVVWARVVPEEPASHPVRLRYEVARDPDFDRVIRRGVAKATAANGYLAEVRVSRLRPATDYFFRFRAPGGDTEKGKKSRKRSKGKWRRDSHRSFESAEGRFVTEDAYADLRDGCSFARGALPAQTLGPGVPLGDQIPIDHWIILMQENRSFDHYFGAMPGVDGIPPGYSNPDADGNPVPAFHETELCIEDVHHSWNASHLQYNGGANDGFVVTNDPGGERAMGWYDASDLAFYWDLYSTFAMSDHHFCSLIGPTWPNRFYYGSATSFGTIATGTTPPRERFGPAPFVINQQLDAAGVSWHVYAEEFPFLLLYPPSYLATVIDRLTLNGVEPFFEDLESGNLAEVVFIEPNFLEGVRRGNSEHPPGLPQIGEAWVERIVRAVMASPIWERTAIVLTYDEHGGYFDHVPPPPACHPGDYPPDLDADDEPGDYDRLGFRVPLVVVSPYSKPGYVSAHTSDLTSVLRLLQARYDLPAMTGRDANAWALLDMFDFENPAFLVPPELDSSIAPSEEVILACEEKFF